MTNLLDYVRWRGDLTLAERPFNVVDNLVLAALAYLDLRAVVPGEGAGTAVPLAQAQAALDLDPLDPLLDFGDDDPRRLTAVPVQLLTDMARSARFAGALLSDYVDVVDPTARTQFAALTVHLDDGTSYVAFRGTDNTIMGWREDFALSFQLVPAQTRALDYLRARLAQRDRPLRVGGHSKGANLALYAATSLAEHDQEALVAVYCNDGPGLSPQVLDEAGLARLSGRVTKIVPEFAVIGMLFDGGSPQRIVASDARGLGQHDVMTWQVEGADLVERPHLSPRAALLSRAFDSWLKDATDADRQAFTDAFFDALAAGGATLILDVGASDYGSFESVLLALARTRNRTRRTLALALRATAQTLVGVDYRGLIRQHDTVRAELSVAAGAFFLAVPALAIRLLGSSVLILLAVLVGARAWRFFVGSRTRRQIPWKPVIAVLAVLAGMLVSLSALDALTVPASLALGGLFLVNGWFNVRRGLRLLDRPVRRRARVVLLLVAAAVSTVLGIFALSTAASVSPGFVVHAGVFCLVSGLLELLLATRDRVARSRVHVDVSALWAQART